MRFKGGGKAGLIAPSSATGVSRIQTIKNFLKNFTRKTDVFHVILGRRRGGSVTAGANRGRNRFSPAILEQEIP